MRILLIGSGGREMALLEALLRSPSVREVHCAPGSDAMAEMERCVCHPVSAGDLQGLLRLAQELQPELTVIGPEDPLANGLSDQLSAAGFRVFGPSRAAARIESSKAYAKKLMAAAAVPTASYRIYTDSASVLAYLSSSDTRYPLVLKENGLRAGKGVAVCRSREEALDFTAHLKLNAENSLLVEEFLEGFEFSLIVMAKGEAYFALPAAQDHKPVFDGNQGPNTGGMGAVSPVPRLSADQLAEAETRVIRPILRALKEDGNPFTGFLYAGLMATADGVQVIEFNARFGDPEAEVILPRIEGDFARAMLDLLEGLEPALRIRPETCLGVVLSSPGYPGKVTEQPELPAELTAALPEGMCGYHMGTEKLFGGGFRAKGGRVFMLCSLGTDIRECREKVYTKLSSIDTAPFHYRRDIGAFA